MVGAGVAGLTAAWLLQQRHRVTLFEKNRYAGGHTNTVVLDDGSDAGTAVDTGFIVLNDRTYPLFTRLLARLGCATQDSDMSFGFRSEESGLHYAGTGLDGLFAQRHNLLNVRYLAMLREILRFCARARADLHAGQLKDITFGAYLDAGRFSTSVRRDYLLPMAGAIWSAPQEDVLAFPAEPLVRFWENHGLLALKDRPRWQTVRHGSHTYVRAMLRTFRGEVLLDAPIAHVRRDERGAVLTMRGGGERRFDRVVLASHADESLRLLADPSAEEQRLLGAWRYQPNRAVLHSDPGLLPPSRRAWASWNYLQARGARAAAPITVTYHMNRLQRLKTRRPYFVTLNDSSQVRAEHILREFVYTHPLYTSDALATQPQLPHLNGRRNTYFCGSYFGYGFHEDAVRSAVDVARAMGGIL